MAPVLLDIGVTDGARTRDNQNHNLGLYQLSYGHRRGADHTGSPGKREAPARA